MKVAVNNTGKAEKILTRRESNFIPELTAADRCDRCGARAYAAALFPGAFHPLKFCGHHFTKWEDAIRDAAEDVVDERERLLKSVKDQKEDVATWLQK